MFTAVKKWGVNLAISYAKDYATVDQLTKWILDFVNSLLKKAMAKCDADKVAKVCDTCNRVSVLCGTLATALADGNITEDEAKKILADIENIVKGSSVSNEKLQALVDKVGNLIKERI